MSKDLQSPKQSEEVDLGQLFKLIGNAFERLFRFIGSIFYKVFLAFVWVVFFAKKHIIKIVIAGIIGFGYGFFKEKGDVPIYKSTTVIKQNYKTGENLYRAIQYYNELISERDSITLSKTLGINTAAAGSLLNLEIESVITENQKLQSYDVYLKSIDSVLAKTVTYEKYANDSEEFQHPIQRITIKARENNVFGSVVENIVNKISATTYFVNEQKKDLDQLNGLKNTILESLENSKELQEVYKNVLENPLDKSSGSQTSISIDNVKDKSITKEFELYNNDVKLRRELVVIQREKEEKSKVIEIVSSQENQGTVDFSLKLFGKPIDSKVYYAMILSVLTFIILLAFRFLKFLEQFKDKV